MHTNTSTYREAFTPLSNKTNSLNHALETPQNIASSAKMKGVSQFKENASPKTIIRTLTQSASSKGSMSSVKSPPISLVKLLQTKGCDITSAKKSKPAKPSIQIQKATKKGGLGSIKSNIPKTVKKPQPLKQLFSRTHKRSTRKSSRPKSLNYNPHSKENISIDEKSSENVDVVDIQCRRHVGCPCNQCRSEFTKIVGTPLATATLSAGFFKKNNLGGIKFSAESKQKFSTQTKPFTYQRKNTGRGASTTPLSSVSRRHSTGGSYKKFQKLKKDIIPEEDVEIIDTKSDEVGNVNSKLGRRLMSLVLKIIVTSIILMAVFFCVEIYYRNKNGNQFLGLSSRYYNSYEHENFVFRWMQRHGWLSSKDKFIKY